MSRTGRAIDMLPDGKIDSLDTHLEQFKLKDQSRQTDLQNLLREYGQLLDAYKTLKKDHEQKNVNHIATPISKAPVVQTAQNPYVLVLIDGNGYIFNDELIREKEEGGMRAARMLNEAVEKYLQQNIHETRNARVIVRIYADLTNLSKQLAKVKVTGLEKRSIAPFSAAFTRAISLFDFVDALDEEGSKFKIREQFKLASEDPACRHILYAACHDSAYLSQLVPFSGLRDKITLVQGAGWNSEFHQFNLNVTQFPTVFRWSGLPTSTPTAKATATNGPTIQKPKNGQNGATPSPVRQEPWRSDSWRNGGLNGSSFGNGDMSPTEPNGLADTNGGGWGNSSASYQSTQPCKYFSKGFCRFGNKCNFQHAAANLNGSSQSPSGASSSRSNISANLPSDIVNGFIPLNKDGQRLDTFLRAPNADEWKIYNARFHKQKPCNSYHLQQSCMTLNCPYDHSELEPESRHTLKYVLRCTPCPKRSECRSSDCYYGHICQKDGCTGQMKGCRMKSDLHNVDPKLGSMVPAEDELVHEDEGGLEMPDENNFMW